jgi:hypothetical protein
MAGDNRVKVFDDSQDPDLAAIEQLVMNEIHGPDLVGCCRCHAVLAQLRFDSAFR